VYPLVPKKDLMGTESQSGFWVLQPNTVKPESLGGIYPHKCVYYISTVKFWLNLLIFLIFALAIGWPRVLHELLGLLPTYTWLLGGGSCLA